MIVDPTPTPFWLVWSPNGSQPPRYQHPTVASAAAEADRLAASRPGSKFYVLAPLSSTITVSHTRETFCDTHDQVPF